MASHIASRPTCSRRMPGYVRSHERAVETQLKKSETKIQEPVNFGTIYMCKYILLIGFLVLPSLAMNSQGNEQVSLPCEEKYMDFFSSLLGLMSCYEDIDSVHVAVFDRLLDSPYSYNLEYVGYVIYHELIDNPNMIAAIYTMSDRKQRIIELITLEILLCNESIEVEQFPSLDSLVVNILTKEDVEVRTQLLDSLSSLHTCP